MDIYAQTAPNPKDLKDIRTFLDSENRLDIFSSFETAEPKQENLEPQINIEELKYLVKKIRFNLCGIANFDDKLDEVAEEGLLNIGRITSQMMTLLDEKERVG